MNIIILGPPGSGKGTQARLLADEMNLFYFESGAFSRNLAEKNLRIAKIINSGELIPEEEMTKYVSEYLRREVPTGQNILFDGYPRFITQYKFLEKWLGNKGSKIDRVFLLEVNDKEVIRRLSARRTCEKCGKVYNLITNPPPRGKCECGGKLILRDDDKPKVIKERLSEFRANTLPMIEYIEKKDVLARIDGERPINAIFKDTKGQIKGKNG